MKIPLATVLCILFGLLSQAHASETAEDFDGRTYILVPQAKNWQMAKRDAEARGGHLVAISSAAEQRFIEQLIDKAMGREVLPVWIGLTDEEGEGIGSGSTESLSPTPTGKGTNPQTATTLRQRTIV